MQPGVVRVFVVVFLELIVAGFFALVDVDGVEVVIDVFVLFLVGISLDIFVKAVVGVVTIAVVFGCFLVNVVIGSSIAVFVVVSYGHSPTAIKAYCIIQSFFGGTPKLEIS